jgi:hypothetical protein
MKRPTIIFLFILTFSLIFALQPSKYDKETSTIIEGENYSINVNNTEFHRGLSPQEVANLFNASSYWKSDGTSTATGDWNLNGINLTNFYWASSDVKLILFKNLFGSHFYPQTDGSIDLGRKFTVCVGNPPVCTDNYYRFNNLWLKNNANIGGNANIDGNATITGMTTTNIIKPNSIQLNQTSGACNLAINGSICSNATGTYIVG